MIRRTYFLTGTYMDQKGEEMKFNARVSLRTFFADPIAAFNHARKQKARLEKIPEENIFIERMNKI